MRSALACVVLLISASFSLGRPANAETTTFEQSLALNPSIASADVDPASLAGRQQYAVDIRLFDGGRIVSETSIAMLEGFPAVIDTRANRSQDIGGGRAGMFQHLSSMVVIETGTEHCWPELGDTREIVDAALEQAELVRVGPVSLWIYRPGTDRYEVRVRSIAPGDGRVGGVEELLGEDSGCLPYMEELEPEAIPQGGMIGGGPWWQEGNY